MAKKSKEELQFQISELRKDKIVYAVESVALSVVGLLLYGSIDFLVYYFPWLQAQIANFALTVVLLPFAYLVFMLIGNLVRCLKIRKLSKELKG